ncbi:plastocyanin/azurin family copper-binding protein [Kitasatospora sp. NPDC001159]
MVAAATVGAVSMLGAGYGSDSAQAAGQQAPSAAAAVVSTVSFNAPNVPSAVQVGIVDFAFSPSTLTVSQGTTVTWTNDGAVLHSVKSDGRGPLHSGPLSPGQSYSFRFNSPGTYSYYCCFHSSVMLAKVIVR